MSMSMQGWYQNADQSQIMLQNQEQDDASSVQDLYEQMILNEDEPIQNYQNPNVKIFTEIIWLTSDKISDHDKLRNKVFVDNMVQIYGQHLQHFVAGPSLIQYLASRKLTAEGLLQKQILLKQTKNYRAINTVLIICTNDTLSFYSKELAMLEHVYIKCIGFRLQSKQTVNCEQFLYRNVKQVYDFLTVIGSLEKDIGSKGESSYYEMFKEFNLYLSKHIDDERQKIKQKAQQDKQRREQNGEEEQKERQQQEEQAEQNQQLEKQEQQFYQKQSRLQKSERIQKQQEPQICELRQKIEVQIGKQLLEGEIYIPLDMQKVNFIIMTTNNAKQSLLSSLSSENFIVKTVQEFNTYITIQSQLPKIVLITTQVQNCFDLIDNYADIMFWIRCCWGRQKLDQQQLIQAFDEKYGSVSDVHPCYDGRVFNVHNYQEFSNRIQELSSQLQALI